MLAFTMKTIKPGRFRHELKMLQTIDVSQWTCVSALSTKGEGRFATLGQRPQRGLRRPPTETRASAANKSQESLEFNPSSPTNYAPFLAAEIWIDNYIRQTRSRATSANSFRSFNLGKAFNKATLENAFAVEELKPEKIPLSQMGLTEFRDFEMMPVNGITYKNTFFIQRGRLTASLAFHEMVHVVQWEEIGAENFLLAYGIGLKAWGYFASPLEAMAYDLEVPFNLHKLPIYTEAFVRKQTRLIFASPLEHPLPDLTM